MMTTAKVGIRELRAKLSAYLRRVKKGESIAITEHGTVVGLLVPAPESLESAMKRVLDSGMALWSGKKLGRCKPVGRVRGRPNVSDLLIEDRK